MRYKTTSGGTRNKEDSFKYLGTVIKDRTDPEKDIIIKAFTEWRSWKESWRLHSDIHITIKVRRKNFTGQLLHWKALWGKVLVTLLGSNTY